MMLFEDLELQAHYLSWVATQTPEIHLESQEIFESGFRAAVKICESNYLKFQAETEQDFAKQLCKEQFGGKVD